MARFHLAFGWCSLLVFLTLGMLLEVAHGFKAGFYLDAENETRRLMWTLAHAHGTLFSLIHIVFAVTVERLADWKGKVASRSLTGATILMPAGFFLGGAFIYDGDPGLGILLVPPGAVLLFLSVCLTAKAVLAKRN